MIKSTVTAHLVVKNDDQWVWYTIQSLLPFVDRFLITDTGSTDHTVERIQLINDSKIEFNRQPVSHPADVVSVRQQQLANTRTDWLWMIDADEIYPESVCQEILSHLSPDLMGIVVRRYDCLGDLFHYQPNENVGGYRMFGTTAHASLRLINCRTPGLRLSGEYPNEGFYDHHQALLAYPAAKFYTTSGRYFHATYLNRSSLGKNLRHTFHRMKYKVERGKEISSGQLPEVLNKLPPPSIPIPSRRSLWYEIQAAFVTPIKLVKRKISP